MDLPSTQVDDDPRNGFLKLISLEKSRVYLTPPIVFLFGGILKPIDRGGNECNGLLNDLSIITSLRHKLYNLWSTNYTELHSQLTIVENAKGWLNDSIYPDLLSFEEDLAQTSTLVIIILESEGAIAELGAFTHNESLKEKIVVIMDSKHYEEETGHQSFIQLGLLRKLNDRNVLIHSFLDKHFDDLKDEMDLISNEIISLRDDTLQGEDKTEVFDKNNNGHKAFLIFEIISIFKAITFTEIGTYLEIVGINIDRAILKRLLYLLQILGLIDKHRYSNQDYYLNNNNSKARIKIGNKDKGKPFDRNEVEIAVTNYYNIPQEKKRFKAMRKK